jgi:predicted ABC-type ATPase
MSPRAVGHPARIPQIYVLAGTNGAGKSSIAGKLFRQKGADYFNPDEATNRIISANKGIALDQANSAAWNEGKRLLERAIAERLDFAFETTLGGRTITALLESAIEQNIEVHVWFVGLRDPELHIQRVRARSNRGGHDIPDSKIRERYLSSRVNLIRLMPNLAQLWVYDNSEEADPVSLETPNPKLILHMLRGKVIESCTPLDTPEWAKPIMATAVKC